MSDWEQFKIGLPSSHGVATYPAGASFGPRLMRDWEFVWIVEGDAVYRREAIAPAKNTAARASAAAQEVLAPAGSIVLCRPAAIDSFTWDANCRTRHAFFHFRVHSLPISWPDCALWPLVRTPIEGDLLRPLFRHVLARAEAHSGNTHSGNTHSGNTHSGNTHSGNTHSGNKSAALEGRLGVAHLLASFVSGHTQSADVPHQAWPDIVERVWRAIHERPQDSPSMTLPELGAIACATPEHLCRVFKAATGWSPMEAQRLARLDRAATLLFRSNYGVAEIALLCGFTNAFHFSRRFKEAYGQSPRDLRNAVREGQTPPVPRLLQQSHFQLPDD